MSDTRSDLANRLTAPEETGLDPALLVPLLRLLAEGEPVSIEQLATATGRTAAQVRASLAAVPDTEYDDKGRIVGQGLTLRPTPHRFTVDGRELYTWCALDTLMFPGLIDKIAHIQSASPASGGAISLTADRHGVADVKPTTAVVSLVSPEDMSSIRSSFCNQVHFFASPEDAEPWLAEHPEAEVLPVADAYQLGSLLMANASQEARSGDQTPIGRCNC